MSRPGRPVVPERVEAQRTRILDAAQACFIDQGFHAASMASIADTAGMSAGLIYRYFESKNAIVLAIIERELVRIRERIAALHTCVDFSLALVEMFRELQTRQGLNAALYLDMSAEATRVPQIAEALRAADTRVRGDFAAWLAKPVAEGGLGIAKEEARRRALIMQLVAGGITLRAARTPDLDVRELRAALEPMVAAIVEPAPSPKRR